MQKTKRFVGALALIIVALASCYSAPAAAHVQASSNGVTAVMHILPDDSPIADKQTLIQFTLGGKDVDTATCDCTLQIRQGSTTTASNKLKPLQGSQTVVTSSISFPKEGVYDLIIASNDTQKFSIDFVVRVDPSGGAANTAGGVDVLFISAASLVIVAVLGYYAITGGGRYTKQKTK